MTAAGAAPVTMHLRITGKVQGVWYRGWAVDAARGLELSGWVRNRADGSVEALLHGPENIVQQMIEACGKGPPAARVDAVIATPASASGEDLAGGFTQRPSA